MAIMLISIFSCFQKKEKKNDLPTWLETNFPGQMDVAENLINLDLKNLFYKKKSSIIADKNDPEIQIKVDWYKNQQPDLGLSAQEVKTTMESSRKDVAAARKLFKALKEKGLGKISVGVIDMAAYILIYEEPTPELRKDYLGKIISTLDALPNHDQTSIWINCMEPAIYQADFKDIVLLSYWKRQGNYSELKKIMSHNFERSPGLKVDVLNPGWAYNTNSERTSQFREGAYQTALAWAEKNLPSPFYLEPVQMTAIGLDDEDPLAIKYYFPYFSTKPDTSVSGFEDSALGYVTGVYQTDKKTFIKIKKIKEL